MKIILAAFSAILISVSVFSQEKKSDTLVLTFSAHTAIPATGGTQHLTGPYDLRIIEGKVISFLPYYGRSFFSTRTSDGGIKFTSYEYEIKQNVTRKGVKELRIRFRDVPDVREMLLSISPNGHATLFVVNSHRQNITFHGEMK
jgi:hypothetical protein